MAGVKRAAVSLDCSARESHVALGLTTTSNCMERHGWGHRGSRGRLPTHGAFINAARKTLVMETTRELG